MSTSHISHLTSVGSDDGQTTGAAKEPKQAAKQARNITKIRPRVLGRYKYHVGWQSGGEEAEEAGGW